MTTDDGGSALPETTATQDAPAHGAVPVPRWMLLGGTIVVAVSIAAAVAFALVAYANRNEWKAKALDTETELGATQDLLEESERDVRRLEDRVQQVANEKARVEDERALVQAERDAVAAERDAIANVAVLATETATQLGECNDAVLTLFDETLTALITGYFGIADAALVETQVQCSEAESARLALIDALAAL